MLEKAYKKDSGKDAISAIELLFLSIHSLSIMHVVTVFKYDFRYYLLTSSYIFSAYYILKSIILYTKEKKQYLDSLSDISEIVKKDEPIKKEAKKKSEKIEETKTSEKENDIKNKIIEEKKSSKEEIKEEQIKEKQITKKNKSKKNVKNKSNKKEVK